MSVTYLTRVVLALVVGLPALVATAADESMRLEQIVSREHPNFVPVRARLTVGRDGKVYLAANGSAGGYVLRVNLDGRERFGGDAVYAIGNATADSTGIVASANAHFAHQVTFYDARLRQTQAATDFLNNDVVQWSGPPHVEVGASGDFYGLDHNRNRVVRLSAMGKQITTYPYLGDRQKPGLFPWTFRVCEATNSIYLLGQGDSLRCVGFDGTAKWSLNAGVSWGDPTSSGGFDVDDQGRLYVIGPREKAVRIYGPDGVEQGKIEIKHQPPATSEAGEPTISELRVVGERLVLRHRHSTELFQVYDRQSGERLQVVEAQHEKFAVSVPRRRWIAGEQLPFEITLTGGSAPQWRVRLEELDDASGRELPLVNGKVTVPADLCGLYLLRVSPELRSREFGKRSEYELQTWVDVRPKETRATISLWTETRRARFACGEPIDANVQWRGEALGAAEAKVVVRLVESQAPQRVIAEEALSLIANGEPVRVRLTRELTATLRPGSYRLTATDSITGLAVASQLLTIGEGATSPLHFMQYGDYGNSYPATDVWDLPRAAAGHAAKLRRVGINTVVDRIGIPMHFGAVERHHVRGELDPLHQYLQRDPAGPAIQKYAPPILLGPTLSAYGAAGIEQMGILMYNDAGLPLGTGFDNRKEPELVEHIRKVTEPLAPFPAFRGWSWSSNWWVFHERGSAAAKTPEEKAAYMQALKVAKENGRWSEVLDTVSTRRLTYATAAQDAFNRALSPIAERQQRRLVTASAAPYRNVESYPPLSLANVDEVDLQAQWEQIAIPYHVPHSVDFYRRPGKPAWLHPEIWNDSGTGEQILPTLFMGLMRGADGIGYSGQIGQWGRQPADSRNGYAGTASVFRALGRFAREYGPWLASLESNDRVAIIVSGRILKIDDWPNVYGTHFARLLEAYASCLHARHPAQFVFAEDVRPDTLAKFRAVLIVGQTVEFEPQWTVAFESARRAGTRFLHDGTCRAELVKPFEPLGVSFNRFEKDPHPASDDSAYLRFPAYLRESVPTVERALDAIVPPVASCDHGEVLLSERRSGQGRVLFVVNNTTPELEPGHIWRTTLLVASRTPVDAQLKLTNPPAIAYDILAGRAAPVTEGRLNADLRQIPTRLFALLPSAIESVVVAAPSQVRAGEKVACAVRVQDTSKSEIATTVPIRLRLIAAKEEVLDEQFGVAGPGTAPAALIVPRSTTAGRVEVEATELFSGQSARLTIEVLADNERIGFAPVGRALLPVASSESQTGKSARPTWSPAGTAFGPHLRDVAITHDGRHAVINAFNWDTNLFGVDLETGDISFRRRVGQYFAIDPQPAGSGSAVQGFDFTSAQGYHLHLLDERGQPTRRFALHGLPQRLPHRFVPGLLQDRMNNFAAAPNGSWVATAGDLGLAIWSREGQLKWIEPSPPDQTAPPRLLSLDDTTLLVVDGLRVSSRSAADGKIQWQQTVAAAGETRFVRASRDGRTIAVATSADGGRVFMLVDGQPVNSIPTAADELDLAPDGSRVAVLLANQLKLFAARGGLRWIMPGSDTLHAVRFSRDSQSVACGSELGDFYVADCDTGRVLERDCESLPTATWTANGDIVVATWMGQVMRLAPDLTVKWRKLLTTEATDLRGQALAVDHTPTSRLDNWSNAEPAGTPLPPNVLNAKNVRIDFRGSQNHFQLARPPEGLVDGKLDPPAEPWLPWGTVSWFAEGVAHNSLVLDTFHRRFKVNALTLVEDAAHPESWIRDARLEAWDSDAESWFPVHQLRSDQAVHTHRLPRVVEASRWRIVFHRHLVGNLRWSEILLHGEDAGSSHPDVRAKRPVAVLFDESDELLDAQFVSGTFGVSFAFENAHSGGRFLKMDTDRSHASPFRPPFGHVLPTWDFEIAEQPAPGQYRYLQFAAKSLSPDTKGWTLRLDGDGYGNSVSCYAGSYTKEDDAKGVPVSERPGSEWQIYRVDLWKIFQKPIRIRGLRLAARGGPAGFDQVLLKRETDSR